MLSTINWLKYHLISCGRCKAAPPSRSVGEQGRRSLGFDVMEGDEILFHIHFDGADGKCQLRNLRVDRCVRLAEWEQTVPAE